MKKNLIFIAKCILASFPLVLICLYTAINPWGYMDEEYPSWEYSKRVYTGDIRVNSDRGTTLILGDSRTMSDIDPTKINDGVINLAFGGGTSIEMYYTLLHYIENNGAPENAVIMFAPFHYSYMDNFETRTLYFNYLSLKEVMDVYSMGKYYGARVFDDFNRGDIISYYLKMPDKYLPALYNSKFYGRYRVNEMLSAEQVIKRGHALYGRESECDLLNYEANYESMNKDGEHALITLYFEKLLNLCDSYSINTVVLQAPMNEASYESLDDNYVSQYRSYINDFAKSHGKIRFETEIPCYENSCFGDASHLNERGCNMFSSEIVDKYPDVFK